MRGFELDEHGDVVLRGGDIACIENGDLLAQTLRQHITQNQGEWWLNPRQGIAFGRLLGKNPNPDLVRCEIQQALLQLDEGLLVDEFETRRDGRRLQVRFTAKTRAGATEAVNTAFDG